MAFYTCVQNNIVETRVSYHIAFICCMLLSMIMLCWSIWSIQYSTAYLVTEIKYTVSSHILVCSCLNVIFFPLLIDDLLLCLCRIKLLRIQITCSLTTKIQSLKLESAWRLESSSLVFINLGIKYSPINLKLTYNFLVVRPSYYQGFRDIALQQLQIIQAQQLPCSLDLH